MIRNRKENFVTDSKENKIYTEQLNLRLTAEEKRELETKAKQAGVPLGTWGREQLLAAVWPTGIERRRLVFLALASEISRLTSLALFDQLDLSDPKLQAEIEQRALASAEKLADRWAQWSRAKGGL